MTEFFPYEILSWPEIAALPRTLPLVIPLGEGYPMERLAENLGNPPRAGILPAIPFGWRGSGISVAEQTLSRFVRNLVQSLRDDGFARVYALKPPGINLHMGEECISLPPARMDTSRVPGSQHNSKVVLIPIGHTEQHGYHLPMSTDTAIIDAISRRTSSAVPDLAVSLPVTPYGVSTHRASFAGTLNAGGREFEDFWLEVVDSLVTRGFEKIYLLSGHGGSVSFLVNVTKYAGERHPGIFCATSSLYLSGPQGIESLERLRGSAMGGMGHACELETSLMLHLQPGLVHMEKAVDETDFITTPSYYMDWIEGGALIANPSWEDDTKTGAYGAGSLGTAEKGELWLDAAVQEKIIHVEEIHQQYQRRKQRRLERNV